MKKNIDAKFVTSISLHSQQMLFSSNKEIVFLGRSNVGKSSLMNALLQKKDLVKVWRTPGKTKTVNIFSAMNKYYFTDLPGYGFAKLGKQAQEYLDGLISWYIEEKKRNIQVAVLIIDAKIWAQEKDIDMFKFLQEMQIPLFIAVSKVDRLNNNDRAQAVFAAEKIFFGQKVFAISAKENVGIDALRKEIFERLTSK